MESELSYEQFYDRLIELTAKESSFSFFTSYDFSGKPFNGTFSRSTFELTMNSHWQQINGKSIKGRYKKSEGGKTEVAFEVGTSKVYNILIRVLPPLILLVVNGLLLFSDTKFEVSDYLGVSGGIVFILLLSIMFRKFSMFIVKQTFKHEFEIDIKPTDLYGYGGEGIE